MKDGSTIEPLELRPLVDELARRWGYHESPQFVRHFSNVVYRLGDDASPRYLRITAETQRSRRMLESEVQFVAHVKSQGVSAAEPIASSSGSQVEASQLHGETYFACLFEEAVGQEFMAVDGIDLPVFFRSAGRLLGEIHEASRCFEAAESFNRLHWREDRWHMFTELVPESEVEARRFHAELMRWIDQQPTDRSYFGMIHGDYCVGNLRLDGDEINVFDFDACCRHWYAYDIAIFLHYFGAGNPEARTQAYDNLLDGYADVAPLNRVMQNQIPMFGKMRLLFSYLVFAEKWGFENLEEFQERYFELRRRLFETDPIWPTV